MPTRIGSANQADRHHCIVHSVDSWREVLSAVLVSWLTKSLKIQRSSTSPVRMALHSLACSQFVFRLSVCFWIPGERWIIAKTRFTLRSCSFSAMYVSDLFSTRRAIRLLIAIARFTSSIVIRMSGPARREQQNSKSRHAWDALFSGVG